MPRRPTTAASRSGGSGPPNPSSPGRLLLKSAKVVQGALTAPGMCPPAYSLSLRASRTTGGLGRASAARSGVASMRPGRSAPAVPTGRAAAATARRTTAAPDPDHTTRALKTSALDPVDGCVRLECARQPQGPAESARARGRPRQAEPPPVGLVGLARVDEHVAVAIIGARALHADLLVPAVLAAHGVRLNRERQVLV